MDSRRAPSGCTTLNDALLALQRSNVDAPGPRGRRRSRHRNDMVHTAAAVWAWRGSFARWTQRAQSRTNRATGRYPPRYRLAEDGWMAGRKADPTKPRRQETTPDHRNQRIW